MTTNQFIITCKSEFRSFSTLNRWIYSRLLAIFSILSLTGCPSPTSPPGEGGIMAGDQAGNMMRAGDEAGEEAGQMLSGEEAGEMPQFGQLGDPCSSVAQCESGICFSEGIDEQGVCTSECDSEESECPLEGFVCRQTTSFGYICIPAETQAPCSPCEESFECGTTNDYCIFFPEEGSSFCTLGCDEENECPAGHTCTFLGGEMNQCFPDSGFNQCDLMDGDGDGILDVNDNCPNQSNTDQIDSDADGWGDACDYCSEVIDDVQQDSDMDGFGDTCDVCPQVADEAQVDTDEDGFGDVCDNCPTVSNPNQTDGNDDNIGDACTTPEEAQFSLGGPVGATGLSSSPNYTLVGGMIGAQRSGVLSGPSYQLRPYP